MRAVYANVYICACVYVHVGGASSTPFMLSQKVSLSMLPRLLSWECLPKCWDPSFLWLLGNLFSPLSWGWDHPEVLTFVGAQREARIKR